MLAVGDIACLRCEGGAEEGAWLHGQPAEGKVEVAAGAASWWRVHDAGDGAIALQCLSGVPGFHWLAADGRGGVRLVTGEGNRPPEGAAWCARELGRGLIAIEQVWRGRGEVIAALGGRRWSVHPALSNFVFDPEIAPQERARLLERHRFALSRIAVCNRLEGEEKAALLATYKRPIRHSMVFEDGVNGRAEVGGSQIWVNFAVLFAQGDDEIAQTLIHEMMHCAGFTHPQRQGEDRPNDGGVYYESAPLRAEMCIAGVQSDVRDGFVKKVVPNECAPSSRGRMAQRCEG